VLHALHELLHFPQHHLLLPFQGAGQLLQVGGEELSPVVFGEEAGEIRGVLLHERHGAADPRHAGVAQRGRHHPG